MVILTVAVIAFGVLLINYKMKLRRQVRQQRMISEAWHADLKKSVRDEVKDADLYDASFQISPKRDSEVQDQ